MEAEPARSLVIRTARLAQRKPLHRRGRAIVGQTLRNREARTAMGAVDEGIAMEAALGIEQFGEALIARGGVRHDPRRHPAADAFRDAEVAAGLGRNGFDHDVIDARQWRGLPRQRLDEARHLLAFDLDHDALRVIGDEAPKMMAPGQTMDIGAKAHALHGPADAEPETPGLQRQCRPGRANP